MTSQCGPSTGRTWATRAIIWLTLCTTTRPCSSRSGVRHSARRIRSNLRRNRYTEPLTPTFRSSCWQTPSTRPRAPRVLISSRPCSTTSLKGGTAPSASRAATGPTGNSVVLPSCLLNTPSLSSSLPTLRSSSRRNSRPTTWFWRQSAERAYRHGPDPAIAVRPLGRGDWGHLQPDGPGHHLHLQHHEDDQLVHGRVLHDRQLRAVCPDCCPARAGAVVHGPASGHGHGLLPGSGDATVAPPPDVCRWHRAARRVRDDCHHCADGLLQEPGHCAGRAEPIRPQGLRQPAHARTAADLGESLCGPHCHPGP